MILCATEGPPGSSQGCDLLHTREGYGLGCVIRFARFARLVQRTTRLSGAEGSNAMRKTTISALLTLALSGALLPLLFHQLRREVGALWSNSMSAFMRLYAFGADAYSLVKELGTLRAQQYAEFDGVTGKLSLNENNRINRRLVWARFEKGTPRILDNDSNSIQR